RPRRHPGSTRFASEIDGRRAQTRWRARLGAAVVSGASCRPPSFDTLKLIELVKRLAAITMEPSVVAADDEPTLGVALMLDAGPAEGDDKSVPLAFMHAPCSQCRRLRVFAPAAIAIVRAGGALHQRAPRRASLGEVRSQARIG